MNKTEYQGFPNSGPAQGKAAVPTQADGKTQPQNGNAAVPSQADGAHHDPEIKATMEVNDKVQTAFGEVLKFMLNLKYETHNVAPGSDYGYGQYAKGMDGVDLPKCIYPMRLEEINKKKIDHVFARATDVLFGAAASFISNSTNNIDLNSTAQRVPDLFGTLRDQDLMHRLIENYDDDLEFCRQLIQGVNPLMITVVDKIDMVPDTMRTLSAPDGKDKDVKALIAEKRLFMVDYKELIPNVSIEDGKPCTYAPILLVYKRYIDNQLDILGIQLERKSDANANPRVYTRNEKTPELWRLVKMNVAASDNQCHEFHYHLGLSHFGIEPVCIAVQNRLQSHDIGYLLLPHLRGTLLINFLARIILVGDILPGKLEHLRLASEAWKNYSFFEGGFAKQIQARGFDEKKSDGLDGYYYREDGYGLWNAIGRYVTNAIDETYDNDYDVLKDSRLQDWAKEMHDPNLANVKGFPETIKDKATLVSICQIIIWNGSALHSAINYSQWPYFGYFYNRPLGLVGVPKQLAESPNKDIDLPIPVSKILENPEILKASLVQLLFAWLLTQQDEETTLDKLNATAYPEVNEAFKQELKLLKERIDKRNRLLIAQGKIPYTFLLPENVQASVNI